MDDVQSKAVQVMRCHNDGSIIFTNGTGETRMAAVSKEKQQAKIRSNIVTTQIQELGMFYVAETEHQLLASKGEATDRMSVFVKSRQNKSGHAPDEETSEVIVLHTFYSKVTFREANGGCGNDHGSIALDDRVRFTSTVRCDGPAIERPTSQPHPPFAAHSYAHRAPSV
ncbi:Peptide methionine sulfoxide reductase A5 [Acorus calamus]|uniref:peptide-methionine (S)-S-oxide reductase n=1 Tax=Acorus calamus TaxID=4465 RepID=A0AAV9D9W6_ACOCL|nr:Peptide methionine sulfoxide reductase A5 [Acorus calamus]